MAFPHDGVKFQPGQSGNPKGIPKGTKHISTWIKEALEEEIEVEDIERGKHKEIPIKAIVRVAIMKAKDGDNKWADWLAKYGYGQKLQLGNDPDNPLPEPQKIDMDLVTQFMMMAKDQTKQ